MQVEQEELLTVVPALIATALAHFGEARLRAAGGSMFPTIRPGDVLTIRRCAIEQLREGDVILVRDGGARVIAHRLLERVGEGPASQLVMRGDSHWENDPVRPAIDLLGRVTTVHRQQRVLDAPFRCSPIARAHGLLVSEWARLRYRAAYGLRWLAASI